MGIAYWQLAYEEYHKDPKLKDNDFIKDSEAAVKVAIIASTVWSVVLDLICIKYRAACDLIIYAEFLHNILLGFAPIDYGVMKYQAVAVFSIVAYLLGVTTKVRVGILVATLANLITFIGIFPLVYNEPLTVLGVIFRIVNILYPLGFIITLSMVIAYVVTIRGQLMSLFAENLSLFNKMHEGLVVVDNQNKDISFANEPAINLLKSLTKLQQL